MGLGAYVAKSIPPPGKLGKSRPAAEDDEGALDAPAEESEGDQEAAELDAMREFEGAETTEEKAAALKNFIAICKGY